MNTKDTQLLAALVVVVLLGVFWPSSTGWAKEGLRGPKCLGPICFDWDIWRPAQPFFRCYGPGLAEEGKFPANWYVEKGIHVYIGRYHGENRPVDTIVVSRAPYFPRRGTPLPPKQSFGPLVTGKGIGLGATPRDVLQAYGTPTHVYPSENMQKRLPPQWTFTAPGAFAMFGYMTKYAEDDYGPWSEFYFDEGKCIAIVLSVAL